MILFVNSVSAASYSLFDDAAVVTGGNPVNAVQVTSDTSPGWGGINFSVPAGLTFNNLTHLMTDYKITSGNCGGGSPRFQININGKNVFVYLGTPPNFTGCTVDTWLSTEEFINSTDTVFDLTQLGGPYYGTYTEAKALYGNEAITGIQLVVDSGWMFGGNQVVLFDNVKINDDVYTFDPPPVTVTIVKYLDGQLATGDVSYPMQSCWSADNIGTGCGSYPLSAVGFNNPNPYYATTSLMTSGADYKTNEITGSDGVLPIGNSCQKGKTRLVGYTYADSLSVAATLTPSSFSPDFKKITSDKYVIVWNESCTTPNDKYQCKYSGWKNFNAPVFKNQGDCVSWIQASEKAWGNRKDN